ncbi:nucleotidyl transferase AbiEii/AbiGii toxin family protein [Paracidovorax anthurii]|uniref:Putative nucleotidyltransferase component of viral defense system n=1 Tax=Paracidovorax anthurii TaxID=78229 RepID=A0A328ZG66_9BURK|nr:nucleotidyl transferase AbiEii/AbiGii toxin family protein [Paracidovorax anthurii]RAR83542.1 putative nucleotidyltransferase component of viral defense system [Paracidovorax anthurii]
MSKGLAASVRARLLNLAKAEGSDFNGVLVRYALERLLYRMSRSAHADNFLLKGALLFALWYDMPHRPTRDVDLLGFGASDLASLEQTFREIASIEAGDGIVFDPATVTAQEIRKDAGYAGARIVLTAEIARARCKVQVDIGFGDAVTPGPVHASYPVLITDFPAPQLRTYPVYSVIAEKLHAIALLGMLNTRMKDYLDLWVMLARETLDPALLATAIAETFSRRGMDVPAKSPIGLSDEFANDPTRQAIWKAFLLKNEIAPKPLSNIVRDLALKLDDSLDRARKIFDDAQ